MIRPEIADQILAWISGLARITG
jgi:hypothetical protein